MKKALLLAAAGLLCASAAFAQSIEQKFRYVPTGETVTEADQLTDGGLYLIMATRHNFPNAEGLLKAKTGTPIATFYESDSRSVPESTINTNLVWQLNFVDGDKFTLKSLGIEKYISNNNNGTGNVQPTDGNNPPAAQFQAIKVISTTSEEGGNNSNIVISEDVTRFVIKATNAIKNNSNLYWYGNVKNEGDDVDKPNNLQYWAGAKSGSVQVQFIPVEAREYGSISVTVHLPDMGGLNATTVADKPLDIEDGKDASEAILDLLEDMGGMANATITAKDGSDNMTVSSDNNEFTVAGTWDRELVPGRLYRIDGAPSHRPAPMRYDAINECIVTALDYQESYSSFNYLVPERFWFVKEVEGGITIHTLAAPDKGIYVTSGTHDATLSDTPTVFTIGNSAWNTSTANDNVVGDFWLTFGGDKSILKANDNKDNEYNLFQYTPSSAAGIDNQKTQVSSAFRVYPVTASDLENLGISADEAKDFDKLAAAINSFNETNVDAALRRVRYLGANLIGPYVGQFNNAEGNAYEMYQKALTLPEDADDETKHEIVEALSDQNLTKLELVAGKFYRFKNYVKNNSKDYYISSISSFTNTSGRSFMDLTSDGTRSNTVFYLQADADGNWTMVSFDEGLVMPSFTSDDWVLVTADDSDAAKGTQIVDQNNGRFIIHVSGSVGDEYPHRHLRSTYGADGNYVNAGAELSDDEYQWYVELVKELPITYYNVMQDEDDPSGWTSVYSPVALSIDTNTLSHTTAYTGEFDSKDYTGKRDVNHVLATPIEADKDGIIMIPANQPALLFYDGKLGVEENPNIAGSLKDDRQHITYVNIPLAYDYESTEPVKGNLKGSFTAISNDAAKDFFTLHASHNNNFREYSEYAEISGYKYVPGFKVYLEMNHAESDKKIYYPIYTINPNTMVAVDGEDGFSYTVSEEEPGKIIVTVTTASDAYDVYFKQPTSEQSPMRRVLDHVGNGYRQASKSGNVHTFTVDPGTVEYYAYHPLTDFQGVVRTATVTTTGISEISAEGVAKVFDLQGRKLAAPAKGINIVNGRKVLVK